MEFSTFKTFAMAMLVTGSLAVPMTAMAVAPVSILPSETQQETLQSFTLVFDEGATVAWNVSGTPTAPKLKMVESESGWAMTAGPSSLAVDANTLIVNFPDEVVKAGEYEFIVPAGAYTVDGVEGDECIQTYEVAGMLMGYTVEPGVSILSEIQNIKITFNDADNVTLSDDLGTLNSPVLYLINEDGARERRGTFMPQVAGNNLLLTMNSAIADPGEYVVVVPGTTYFLDGAEGTDIEISYTVVEPSYPEVELSVNPATSIVETIETIELTFGGVDIVEWAVTGTENAPYLRRADTGDRWTTFANLGGEGNMLSLGLFSEFDVKGEYEVVIPAGSYVFQGIYHGMPGEEIVLNYEVLGLGGYTVEPGVSILSEIQNIKITFNEAAVVTLSDDLGTLNSPVLYLINEDGARERRGTFMPQVAGNNLLLTMNSPIADPGEYVVVVPGTTYFLDGAEGTDIEISYTVVEPSYPEVELSVNPATSIVETIETIELTFGGVDIVEWAVTGTENAPYLRRADTGDRWATFARLGGEGNMLSLGLFSEFDVKGEYEVVIPAGSYVFQGIYHGMPGEEIVLNYEVLGLGGYTVEPGVSILSEIQNIKITFNEAAVVTLSDDLGTLNSPVLYLINEEGARERRGTFMPQVAGNNLLLTMNSPIADAGEYVVVVPGTTYFLDGVEGTDIEIYYTVVPVENPFNHTIEPAEGTVEELNSFAITFVDVAEASWNLEAIYSDPSLFPNVKSGEEVDAILENLTSAGNVLSAASYGMGSWTTPGSYILTIPAGSYTVDGQDGEEIIAAYIVVNSGTSAIDTVFGNMKSFDVYDINGRVIMHDASASSLKSLRGIYIIEGKKYILR